MHKEWGLTLVLKDTQWNSDGKVGRVSSGPLRSKCQDRMRHTRELSEKKLWQELRRVTKARRAVGLGCRSEFCHREWKGRKLNRESLALQRSSMKVLTRPKGSLQAKVIHLRSPVSGRNGPALVSLPHADIGWRQSMGSVASAQTWWWVQSAAAGTTGGLCSPQ